MLERSDHNNDATVQVIRDKFSETKIEVLQETSKQDGSFLKECVASFPKVEKHHRRKD